MKTFFLSICFIAFVQLNLLAQDILVEAENFENKGGWVVDQQFMDQMGSSYLLAHGFGIPVTDAETKVSFPKNGEYKVFVRTYNWTSPWYDGEGPGKFEILVNGQSTGVELGAKGNMWIWQEAGTVTVDNTAVLSLHDLTGFNGRCDAIFFTKKNNPPPSDIKKMTTLRKKLLGFPEKPANGGNYDFVVVGGGVAGMCAAIASARLGLKVALIHDRPILGGNNSSEVRVHLGGLIDLKPYPRVGGILKEFAPAKGGNAQPAGNYEDEKKMAVVKAEPNISLFVNYRGIGVAKDGSKITSVIARHIETGEEKEFKAPLFADCTGDGVIGVLAGADYVMGRESQAEYGEKTAPEVADEMTMGASVQWYSKKDNTESAFPDFQYGLEFNEESVQKVTMGEWTWETGMNLNQIDEFERIRDYGLLVVFSNWSFLKNKSQWKDEYANQSLDWVAYVSGKRESRRLLGDFILKEQDITDFVVYPDASASTSWSIDLHYPDPENTKHFPDKEFISIAQHINIHPYPLPYRCFYSRNVDNLFMAGRNISVTHVALGTIRVMRTTAMMGEVVGMASWLAKENNTTPRGVYQNHIPELKKIMELGLGRPGNYPAQNYNQGGNLGPKFH